MASTAGPELVKAPMQRVSWELAEPKALGRGEELQRVARAVERRLVRAEPQDEAQAGRQTAGVAVSPRAAATLVLVVQPGDLTRVDRVEGILDKGRVG